jgi:hypothetical protein
MAKLPKQSFTHEFREQAVKSVLECKLSVPAVLAYNFFLRFAKQSRLMMENFVVSFMQIAFVSDNVQ